MNKENEIQKQNVEFQFNGVELASSLEDRHRMIPVRTICQIIDVDFVTQDRWLKEHLFFDQLYSPRPTVGADGKERTMNCLSIFDIDGWVHSIGITGRKQSSIEKQYAFLSRLRELKLQIYKSIDVFMQENKYELELVDLKERTEQQLIESKAATKELQNKIKELDSTIEDIRVNRFTG